MKAKTILSAGLGLLALAHGSPAGAAESSQALRWQSGGPAAEDGRLSGPVHLRAEVSTDHPVDGWSISVLTPAQEPLFGVVCSDDFARPRDTFTVDCRWDTTRYADQRPSANGHYLVRLMTRQAETAQPAGPDRDVAVINRASAPKDVALAYDETSRQATLTWAANPEPDVAHYDVQQRTPDGTWTRIAEPTGTRFETTLSEPADYRFRVAAERQNADGAADGPGPWTQAPAPRRSGAHDANRGRSPGQPSRPGSQPRPAAEPTADHRADGGSRADSGRPGRTSDGESAPRPAPAASREGAGAAPERPSPASRPAPAAATGRSASTAPAPVGPPPPDHAPLAFSRSSADALASLGDVPAFRPGPAGPTVRLPAATMRSVPPRPAARPASPAPEPDPGFEQALPYAHPQDAESVTPASPDPAPPTEPPAASPPVRRSSTGRRAAGIGLFGAGAGLLGTALRSTRRERRRRPAAPAPAAAAMASAPVPTRAVPSAPKPAAAAVPSADDPPWVARLEDRLARLEARLAAQGGQGDNGAGIPST